MSTGKETLEVNTTSIDNEEQGFPDPQWRTGLRARFPWNGAIALFTIILCANSSLIVLLVSDGKKQKHWAEKIGPSVLLSAFNGIANICFGVAIANGVAITWWRKALKGATIKELHRSWQFSSSIKDVVLYGRYFNFIALAALAAKLTIIDGILLQKAAGVISGPDSPRKIPVHLYLNDTMPFTANIGDRSGDVSSLIDWFSADVDSWSRNSGLLPNWSVDCDGVCLLDVNGTGFGFDCQSEQIPIDYGAVEFRNAVVLSQSNDTSTFNATVSTLFDITFEAIYGATGVDGDFSRIVMNMTTTNATSTDNDSPSCPGTLTRHNCVLRPAVIKYPVTVEANMFSDQPQGSSMTYSNMYLGYNTTSFGGQVEYTDNGINYYLDDFQQAEITNTSSYDPSRHQLRNFSVVKYTDVLEDHLTLAGDSRTVVGGFANVFNRYFAGSSSMRYQPSLGFVLNQNGSAEVTPFTPKRNDSSTGCDYQYRDPLDYVIREINLLMFAVTLDPWSYNMEQTNVSYDTSATQYAYSIHYKTNHGFMWGALASILVCVLCVIPSYWGYWQLGRDVTLGPFEIANAFRAPVLDHPAVANAGVKDLIREVGQREVKYGAMVDNEASGRLAIAEPEAVRRVHPRISDRRF
ncbi:hypothetical protein KCU98_g3214, partial [Aureobasidium melanogenum]